MRDEEDAVIAAVRAAVEPPPAGVLGIGDDGAVLPGGEVLTTDTMVEGVHWDDALDPEDVGWKLVAVNVSDLGAMGARPAWALLALTLPEPLDLDWVGRFARGLGAACRHWALPLVGGDTTRGPGRIATLTVGGHAAHPVRRDGGRPGDQIWVSGPLGLAAAGFLDPDASPAARAWLRRPEPPVALGRALAASGRVSAMMDLSDGLLRDLGRLCVASGCGALVDPAAVPGEGSLAHRVAFGEDYQLLFTSPASASDAVECLATTLVPRLFCIGALDEGPGVRRSDGLSWPAPLFAHFPPGRRTS